jgi:hypothetical protein
VADSFPRSQAEDQQTERSGRGPEWIALVGFLGVLAFGLVVIMVALAVSRTRARAEAQAPPAVSLEIPTAREAYVPAVETIRERDVGARLATGVGVWTPTIDPAELAAGRTGWTFFFYLPATGEMASVVVDQGGSTHVAEVEAWETPPDLLDDSLWEVDSSQAVSNLLATCQSFLDENEGAAEVQARLSAAAEHRRLLWQTQIVLTDDNQVVCEVNVDATTGQVR